MSIKSEIISNSTGVNRSMKIGEEGEIFASLHPHPPKDEQQSLIPFRQYFTDDGLITGSKDMNVNGLVTPKQFYIEASQDYDIYVSYLSIEISDTGTPNLNKFGDLTALANGVSWHWFTQEEGLYELHEGIKTNKEFTIRIGNDSASFGDGVNAFLADVSGGGTVKSYFPRIDAIELFRMMYGLRLRKSTTDKLIFTVQDDLSSVTDFNIQVYGNRVT